MKRRMFKGEDWRIKFKNGQRLFIEDRESVRFVTHGILLEDTKENTATFYSYIDIAAISYSLL